MLFILITGVQVFFSKSVAPPYESLGNVKLDSVIVSYINSATSSIDMTLYSLFHLDGEEPVATYIVDALKSAKDRGVRIRIIAENEKGQSSSASFPFLQELVNYGIPVLFDGNADIGYECDYNYGDLMHNKFIVIDGHIVITGSTNFSYEGTRSQANNLIIIDNENLADIFTQEFEEMWGGAGDYPNMYQCRFQDYKSDNTPHIVRINDGVIDSIMVFFSPTDGLKYRVLDMIDYASSEIDLNLNVFTRCEYSDAMWPKHYMVHAVVDNGTWSMEPVKSMRGVGSSCDVSSWSPPADIYRGEVYIHHKYAIFDRYAVLTGSMNWSRAGYDYNDENTIIVFSHRVADIYLHEFKDRMEEAGGSVSQGETTGKNLPFSERYDILGRRSNGGRTGIWIGRGTKGIELEKH